MTSFLLIVYYDRKTNNRSGIITFGINRFGDAVLIRTLVFFITDGIMDIYSIRLCDGNTCFVYNTYAWAGSQRRNSEAEKGNHMYQEIMNDAEMRPESAN